MKSLSIQNVGFLSRLTEPAPITTGVVWQNMNNGHTASGNVLSKSGNNWDADATGTVTFAHTEGFRVEFTISSIPLDLFCGFDISTNVDGYNMDYAFYCGGANAFEVYENGIQTATGLGSFTSADTFAVNMSSSGTVTYLKNGSIVYTSLVTASGTYRVNAVIYTNGKSLTANEIN